MITWFYIFYSFAIPMEKCLSYNSKYTPGPKVGSGGFGNIYSANEGDCVMKIVSFKEPSIDVPWDQRQGFISEDCFQNEVDMQNKFSLWGITVPIEAYWMCDGDYGVMVMRRLETTLAEFVRVHPGNEKIIKKAVEKLSNIHFEHNTSHGDYTNRNIMLDTHNYGDVAVSIDIDDKVYYLYLIDFGFSNEGQKSDISKDVEMIIEMMKEMFE